MKEFVGAALKQTKGRRRRREITDPMVRGFIDKEDSVEPSTGRVDDTSAAKRAHQARNEFVLLGVAMAELTELG